HGSRPCAFGARILDAAGFVRRRRGTLDRALDPSDSPVNAALDSTAVPGLAAARLTVRAGARELVRELTVRFAPGEVVAILGRNGSGKTLTLHTLAGLRHRSEERRVGNERARRGGSRG